MNQPAEKGSDPGWMCSLLLGTWTATFQLPAGCWPQRLAHLKEIPPCCAQPLVARSQLSLPSNFPSTWRDRSVSKISKHVLSGSLSHTLALATLDPVVAQTSACIANRVLGRCTCSPLPALETQTLPNREPRKGTWVRMLLTTTHVGLGGTDTNSHWLNAFNLLLVYIHINTDTSSSSTSVLSWAAAILYIARHGLFSTCP